MNDPDAGSLLDLLPAAADEQELWYEAVQHLQTQAAAGGCLVSRSLPEVRLSLRYTVDTWETIAGAADCQ